MRNITSRLLGLLSTGVAALCAVAWWNGFQIERNYRDRVSQLRQGSPLAISALRYERGWLHSTAEVDVALPQGAGVGGGWSVVVREEIYHGPVPIGALREGLAAFRPVAALVRGEAFLFSGRHGTDAPSLASMHYDTTVGFDGVVDTHLVAPAGFANESGLPLQIDWRGLQGTFRTDANSMSGEVSTPGARIAAGNASCDVGALRLRFAYAAGSDGWRTGESRLHIDRIALGGFPDGEVPTLLESVELAEIRGQDEGGASYQSTLRVGSIGGSAMWTGPASLSVAARRLDPAALAQLGGDSQQLLSHLVRGSPELEVMLALGTTSGEARLSMRFAIDGEKAPVVVTSPLAWTSALDADVELFLPRPSLDRGLASALAALPPGSAEGLLADSPQASLRDHTDALLRQGLLVMKPGGFAVHARWRDGTLLVNDRPIALPQTSEPNVPSATGFGTESTPRSLLDPVGRPLHGS